MRDCGEAFYCPQCKNANLKEERSVETGNIFKLKTRFTKAFNFKFLDKLGKENLVLMACYGLGPTRLMGTVVEIFNDQNGIIWQKSIAPYLVHLVPLGENDQVKKETQNICESLQKEKIEVLYDDRDESAGVKLKDADLIGIPFRIVVSEKTLSKNSVEVKKRSESGLELVEVNKLADFVKDNS